MSKCSFAVLCTVAFLLATPMAKADNGVSFRFVGGENWPLIFPKGQVTGGVPTTNLGFITAYTRDRWAGMVEFGIATPNSTFAPAPRTIISAWYTVVPKKFIVGMTGLYQINPEHEKTPLDHVFGVAPAASFPIVPDRIMFILTTGVSKALNGPWSLNFQPRVVFVLPWKL